MSKAVERPRKVTIAKLNKMRRQNHPITVLTAYDYPTGLTIEKTHHNHLNGIDIALVGDSLAFTALGYSSTSQLTLDEMIHHCKAVTRAATTPFVVADMPFGTIGVSDEESVRAALRLVQEGGVDAVKIEGGLKQAKTIEKVVDAGVPVIAHAGLQPQRATQTSGFRVQGKTPKSALSIVQDVKAVEKAGAFAILLEAIPPNLGKFLTEMVQIPTIGIGAGNSTSGQVLVQPDMLGSFDAFKPKFVREFGNVGKVTMEALDAYAEAVRSREFPSIHESYNIEDTQWREIEEFIRSHEN
ncbi:ketopantoate hydroxymethyltransferase [Wallemia mellicola]|nr:ketopantoate hydroxymethyltransferase [Wallemia mellicola CBS 633.66]TIB76498.1 hypothetical protein E3Q23_01826 [Wallemia mellicola]EIM21335.1 ketopantoate hydroxymethyltransferase [Wallemia mellicola CBS 633.66]TIB81364.1 ketopantoate hydroxymethyltransferase [Wallemia mellicola]TIB88723.1 ketopantoate hydroxymethyltransferase [Wallemia mellicola]TIB91425.1 ketopantoate hydroxymethyltransferase [Wallemia mellicola]|eukprot:XP_006958683.1 ketopantoate hydroxymethyltransferase [Wallemia mellicola CBS 633.66]